MSTDYGTDDPRSALKPKSSPKAASFPIRGCGYGRFFDQPAQVVEPDGARTWIIRGATAVVAITEVREGTVLARQDNPDEYMLLLDYDGAATCSAGPEDSIAAGPTSVTIVPPGPSSITFHKPGYAVRCFTSRAEDLAALAQNASAYGDGAPECAPLVDWPAPPGGFRLRSYDLLAYERVTFAHIIRSTNLMLSTPLRSSARRSPQAVSPHHHDDFEQVSIALEGSWVHHLRTPWTSNMTAWRADEHTVFASPSALIIPAGMIHTSQDVGPEDCWLIDLFSPPREDFSRQPGWVLNAADYPAPWEADA